MCDLNRVYSGHLDFIFVLWLTYWKQLCQICEHHCISREVFECLHGILNIVLVNYIVVTFRCTTLSTKTSHTRSHRPLAFRPNRTPIYGLHHIDCCCLQGRTRGRVRGILTTPPPLHLELSIFLHFPGGGARNPIFLNIFSLDPSPLYIVYFTVTFPIT